MENILLRPDEVPPQSIRSPVDGEYCQLFLPKRKGILAENGTGLHFLGLIIGNFTLYLCHDSG